MILPILLLAAVVLANSAHAQQTDRRARDEPEIVVEAGGRVGPADALLFSPDGKFLLAGGDDKVVRVWPHGEKGLDPKAQVLRWRAWREQRGGIKALAIAPDGKRVALGGYGMKPSTVAVLDRETGEPIGLTWPKSKPGDNFNTVMAVAFHPDGKRVGFGTADGSLWLWEPEALPAPDKDGRPSKLPLWVGKQGTQFDKHDKPMEFNFPRLIFFPSGDMLASVADSGQVLAWSIARELPDYPTEKPPPVKPLLNVFQGGKEWSSVYRAILSSDGKWIAVATTGPYVLLCSIDGKQTVPIALPKNSFPRSLALSVDLTRLAVGIGAALGDKPRFYAEGSDRVLIYEKPFEEGRREPAERPHRGRAEALAFHPKDNRLAVAGGDADEVSLLDLATPEKPLSVIRGAGRRIWSVNLTENGSVLGVRTQRHSKSLDPNRHGAGDWSRFDLPRLIPTNDEAQNWVDPLAEADGWTIEPDPDDRFTWRAVWKKDGETIRHALALDRQRDQAPTCFTFLPATNKLPTRVLVGHYYGCSLYELTQEKATHLKLFTGHAGEVLSVVAAKDQSWFVTGGADHTVAAWSLTDWPSQAGLGVSFAENDGKVEVTAVDTGSPGWEAGLRIGDALDLLSVGGKLLFDRRPGQPERGTNESLREALMSPKPRIELFFGWVSKGRPDRKESLTTVRQRPLWKWFPAFNERGRLTDWVVWMWHGSYYHTKSAHGDRLVGWHVNSPDPGGRPEFYQLQQFEKLYHRLDAVEKVVATRDVGAAITLVRGKNPLPVSFSDFEPAPVFLGVGKSVVAEPGLSITVSAKPRGNNPDLLPERVELWLNDHRLEVWPKPGEKPLDAKAPFEAKRRIDPAEFRAGENQLAVLTFNSAGGRAEMGRTVTNPLAARAANLVGLSVGINDYSVNRKAAGGAREFGDLISADRDARDIADRFHEYRGPGKFFPAGKIDLHLEAQATRKQLLQSLQAFAANAKPDDLLVIFFAGHGDLLLPGPAGGTIPDDIEAGTVPKGQRGLAAGGGLFVLCCPDYSAKNPTGTAITAEELFDGLARVNCRKVVLLDACHSGQAGEANLLRRAAPNGQGPFIIASCDQSELAYEHPKLKHGLFTYAVLDALGDGFRRADLDSDGILTAEELFDYTSVQVPSLARQLQLMGKSQNPICFPRQPPKFPVVKK